MDDVRFPAEVGKKYWRRSGEEVVGKSGAFFKKIGT